MRSPARRPLVLATVMALLLGLVGGPATGVLAAQPPDTRLAGIDVDEATIPELQALMNRHRLSSVRLVQFYLHRIRKLDSTLNAVITVNPDALALARAADRARRGGDRRPLLGIPVIVKDNVNTTGMPTTAGSWALAGSTPTDAFIVQRLKTAGAIIIAKANLSEWANFRSIPSSSGWSGIGGQTNLAQVLDRNPCGSSSGTAVAVSADLATVGVGTETDGSIVCPAGATGIVGIKPTVGLLSRAGIIPISADQDTAGPMTRNVTDAAVVLGAMTGIDPDDPATAVQAGHAFTDYRQFLDPDALDGARIGVWRTGTYDPAVSPEVHAIMNAVVAELEAAGVTVIDEVAVPIEDAYGPEFTALLCEFRDDIEAYLTTYTGAGYPQDLEALLEFHEANPDLEGPWNSAIFELALETGGRADPACIEARETANEIARAAVDDTMVEHDLDAIIGPTNGPAWLTDPVNGDLGGDFSAFVGSSSPAAIAGYAAITVPAGYAGPLPVGVTFIGGAWDEPDLIGLAYAYEQATGVRRAPTFLPTLGAGATKAAPGKGPKADRSARPDGAGRMAPLR
ncbi:MAG TPA: amidase [Candidatus Limnocylindrales bacterium]|nr:amidase [Candidatus Limnocylindrales bacterium]